MAPAAPAARRRRTRCFSSARLASWKYSPKARMSTSARGRSMASISARQRPPVLGAVGASQRDGRAPDALDQVQQLLALLLHDDLAQERAQQLDLACERVARAGGPDAASARLGRRHSDAGRRWA